MKAVLAAVGSRGDTVPFAALAARLRREGHEVVLLVHEPLTELVPDHIRVVAIPGDPAALLSGPAARAVARGDVRALNRARGLFADFVASSGPPAAEALDGADVLVASSFAIAAAHEAILRGVPVVRVHLWPENHRLAGPMPLLPYSWRVPGPARRVLRAGLRGMERYLGGFDGGWHRGRLLLYPHYPAGFTSNTAGSLVAVSPQIVPPSHSDGLLTGWWHGEQTGSLDPVLAGRLAEGRWIFVGFGSMHQAHPEQLVEDLAWAIRRIGVNAVLQLPQAALVDEPDLVGIGEVPHDALLPRMVLAVHHGGSGTTGSVVRAGIPSVVVPHFADQYYWGHRLHRLGLAPVPVPRPLLGRERLARAIDAALLPRMARRSSAMARLVASEDGVGTAARHLTALVDGA